MSVDLENCMRTVKITVRLIVTNQEKIVQRLVFILSFFLFVSCVHHYDTSKAFTTAFEKRTGQRADTLVAMHDECTGCLDLVCIQGSLSIPSDVMIDSNTTSNGKFFDVCGHFPMELVDVTAFNFEPDCVFKISGKVIAADTSNGVGSVPLFYVDSWKKIYFSRQAWQKKIDPNTYPKRKEMIEAVINNFMFEGHKLSEIINLLAEPDQQEKQMIRYNIEEKYGHGIDPPSSSYLEIRFDEDSLITGKSLVK